MKTALLLLAQYEKATIPLEVVAQDFFGLGPDKARAAFNANRFPIPAFRMGDSQKSPVLVHLDDLAAHIDAQRQKHLDAQTGANPT